MMAAHGRRTSLRCTNRAGHDQDRHKDQRPDDFTEHIVGPFPAYPAGRVRRRQVRQNKSKASLLSRPLRVLVVEAGYDLDRQNAERQREVTRARPARFATSQPAVRYGMRAWARVAKTDLWFVPTRSDTTSESAIPTTPGTSPITNG